MVKAGGSPYVAGQYDGYNGMRVGFIENSSQVASMKAFAAEKGFAYVPVYYKTSSDLEKAIQLGEDVDAIVASNMRIISGTRRLEMFAMQNVHAMVRKGDKELLSEINHALKQISLYNAGLYDSLYNKYYTGDSADAVFFSPDEAAFISDCRKNRTVLRAALMPGMSPYAYYDGDRPAGILHDIADEILRRTGLAYEIVKTPTNAEYSSLLESRGVDLWLGARFDYNDAEKLGYTLIDPYYSTDISRVTRKGGENDIKTVAVVRGSFIETRCLSLIAAGKAVVRGDSVEECVASLLDGGCDALYLCSGTAQEAVYYDETNRLTSMIMPRFTVGFSIACAKTPTRGWQRFSKRAPQA